MWREAPEVRGRVRAGEYAGSESTGGEGATNGNGWDFSDGVSFRGLTGTNHADIA